MNIECAQETLNELENAFRFNDAVLRKLVIRRDGPITEPSPLLKSEEEKSEDRPRPPATPREAESAESGSAENKDAEPAGQGTEAEA